jgi:microsomal dipeptidase-like Zn-dependent dipeptidase
MAGRAALVLAAAIVAIACGEGEGSGRKLDLVGESPKPAAAKDAATALDPALHRSAFVVDLIQDFVFRKRRDGWTLLTPAAHTSLAREEAGGVDLVLAALPGGAAPEPRALDDDLALMEALVGETGGKAAIVKSLAEAKAARGSGALPIMLLLEGADSLATGDLGARLDALSARGVAAIGIVAERPNAFADPASAPGDPGGLSARGAELVRLCREKGLLVDLTHASPRAFWDALVRENSVVAVTHTAARALRDHPRNLDDLQILGLARGGGVMGLIFNPDFLKPGDPPAATIDDVLAHAAHVRRLGALSALALGTDFGGVNPPAGLDDASSLPALTARLAAAGWSAAEIEGVLGGNALRALAAVEAAQGAAEASQRTPVRPVPLLCDAVQGEFAGALEGACDGYVLAAGPKLAASSSLRLRIEDVRLVPERLELFGEPGTPWQIEAQDLDGTVLIRRIVALGPDGRGELPLPEKRNLTRLFVSPTRASILFEAVVWGR